MGKYTCILKDENATNVHFSLIIFRLDALKQANGTCLAVTLHYLLIAEVKKYMHADDSLDNTCEINEHFESWLRTKHRLFHRQLASAWRLIGGSSGGSGDDHSVGSLGDKIFSLA